MSADDRLFVLYTITKTDEFVSSRYIGAGRAVHSRTACPEQECREVRVACGDLKRPLAF